MSEPVPILPGNGCSLSGPSSTEMLGAGAADTIAALTVAALCVVVTCLLYLFDIMQLLASYRDRPQAFRVFWLLGIYPFFCVTSLIHLCVPRAAILIDFVNTIYFATCCLKFMHITQFYFGGRKQMLEYLQTNGIKFPLRSPPACCCCFCLPDVAPTRSNIIKIYLLLLQFVIVPPFVSFLITIVAIDASSIAVATKEMESVFVLVRTISTSLAFYGLILIFRVSRGPLTGHSITAKFGLMKLAILFGHIQILIFNILGAFSVITCDYLWSSASKAAWINAACLAPEMTVLFLLARRVYRRDDRPMSEYALIGDSDAFARTGSQASVLFGQ